MSEYGKCEHCGDDLTTFCLTCADDEAHGIQADFNKLTAELTKLRADYASQRETMLAYNKQWDETRKERDYLREIVRILMPALLSSPA